MSRPGDFTKSTKETLAERAGYRCSFPGCDVVTVGPSEEGPDATNNTGMACHIYAASKGGNAPRSNHSMSEEELSSINNGIWMCYRHGKMIDDDVERYKAETLRRWRDISELKQKIRHELGEEVNFGPEHKIDLPFPNRSISFEGLNNENERIDCLMRESCVYEIWGEEVGYSVRDLIIETVRNTFTHGGANEVIVETEDKSLRIISDSGKFGFEELEECERSGGGSKALSVIRERFFSEVILSHIYKDSKNEYKISLIWEKSDILESTKCREEVTRSKVHNRNILDFDLVNYCEKVYIILPPYLTFSDLSILGKCIDSTDLREQDMIFVCNNVSQEVYRSVKDRFIHSMTMRI